MNTNLKVIIDLQYLPCPSYFTIVSQNNEIFFELYEYYEKQSFRNRCNILMADGVRTLTVPLQAVKSKQIMKDVKIDYSQNWQQQHIRSLKTAYGKSPFFEYLSEDFFHILEKKQLFLWELNYDLLTFCLKTMGMSKNILFTDSYAEKDENSLSWDCRSIIHPKKGYQPVCQKGLKPYQQVFGNTFVKNLSIVDLIFCEGGNSKQIIQKGLF